MNRIKHFKNKTKPNPPLPKTLFYIFWINLTQPLRVWATIPCQVSWSSHRMSLLHSANCTTLGILLVLLISVSSNSSWQVAPKAEKCQWKLKEINRKHFFIRKSLKHLLHLLVAEWNNCETTLRMLIFLIQSIILMLTQYN